VVLCILDGFGERAQRDANAVELARTPALHALRASAAKTSIAASGEAVGLPKGQMGNSEVGHMILGAGRTILSDRTRIDRVIADDKLGLNPTVDETVRRCLYHDTPLHLFGLLSDGGVHSHMDHLLALIDQAHFQSIPVVVHAFLDGRDTPPQSAMNYLNALEYAIEDKNVRIGTLSGRFYAMDRDERWDRVYCAFHAIVRDQVLGPEAPRAESTFDAVSESYLRGLTDEFLEPVRIGDYQGVRGDFTCDFDIGGAPWEWTGDDCGIAFNFRGDRMQQLCAMLTRQGLPASVASDLLMDRDKPVRAFQPRWLATMTSYADSLEAPIAFPKQTLERSFGELIAEAGLSQLRCAESEKYPHVTYFFNGGREQPFAGEERMLVPSPRLCETYDEKPEMSAAKVAENVVRAVKSGDWDVIVVNFANPDMVGHTGKLEAAVAAVEAVDRAIGDIVAALREVGGALLLTADHGNCETMIDDEGNPHTAHTTNPVPLVYFNPADPGARLRDGGKLEDVAPTLLDIMGLEQPPEMTGRSLRITG
jgi:2,3-bisphosphoglycerate-independent phosphoglycerate mutase